MAQVSINIPDALLPRVVNAFCIKYNYNVGMGITKQEFARKCMIDIIRTTVTQTEESQAVLSAQQAAEISSQDIVLT
jgi:hypothetical protein